MTLFSSSGNSRDLHGEIAALRRDISALSRSMSKRGAAAWRDAGDEAADLYGEISSRIAHALPAVRRRARDLEETIRDHPTRTVAVVGLAALAVAAAAILIGGRR